MIAKIVCLLAAFACVYASGYGYGHPSHGQGGYGKNNYHYGYNVKLGDYHSKATVNHQQNPYEFRYNVYQTHPYGGHSQIYHSQSNQGYGYGH